MRSFASDNNSGVHPLVMEALNRANSDHAVGYGDDPWTEEAVRKIREAFTPDCEPLFVFNGTGSNAVALQLCTRPYNSIICAETAHIYVDECGAPARMTEMCIRDSVTAGASPMDIKRGIDKAVAKVVDSIKGQAETVGDNYDKIEQVASVSANNDPVIGKLIADAMRKVSKDGVITIEEAKGTDTTIGVVEGIKIPKRLFLLCVRWSPW